MTKLEDVGSDNDKVGDEMPIAKIKIWLKESKKKGRFIPRVLDDWIQ